MQIGQFIEVLDIVPDETPGLSRDGDAQGSETDVHASVIGLRVDSGPARRPVHAS